MAETQETVADIIAEMRERKSQLEDAIFNAPLCYSTDDMRAKVEILDEFLDRFETAHRREVAHLRAALEKAEAVIDGVRMMVLQGQEYDLDLVDFGGALAKCRDALSATETKGEKQ